MNDRLLGLLDEIFGDDQAAARAWLDGPIPEWCGLTPQRCIDQKRGQAVIDYLERRLVGEVSST